MLKFEKVSFYEYLHERTDGAEISKESEDKYYQEWLNIKLPKRSTSGSAGYDFYAPYEFEINENSDDITINTGIRWISDNPNLVLVIVPRSGLGFKFMTKLNNTLGVIDSDYWHSDNEGHIKARLTSKVKKLIKSGDAFMQGIILNYFKTDDDDTTNTRNGGFGSTDNSSK